MVDFNGETNAFTDEEWAAHLERTKKIANEGDSVPPGAGLDGSTWHARLYLWTRRRWFRLWNSIEAYQYLEEDRFVSTNTCMYIRTLFVLFPFILVVYAALIAAPFVAVFYPPLAAFGTVGLLSVIGSVLGAAIGALVAFYLLKPLFRFVGWAGKSIGDSVERCANPNDPGLCRMIIRYVVDWHNKVCTTYQIRKSS